MNKEDPSPRSANAAPLAGKVRVLEERVLCDDWSVLKSTRLDYQRRDGRWQTLKRETYDRGNGAVVLLVDRARRVVRLTRQFRYPAYVNGWQKLMIEAPAGLLDDASPEARIRAEAEEEAGVRITAIQPILEAYMSPGSVTEKLHFFLAEYDASDVVSDGGGVLEEGEDIEVMEVGFDEALAMIDRGVIVDGKTILLLLWARQHVFGATSRAASQPQLILVAGPYRSGTGDRPELIERNLAAMTEAAAQVAQRGHVPLLGEWVALPVLRALGSSGVGDALYERHFHALARQLVQRCDACLRIGGASKGADEMVALARARGLTVYSSLADLPPAG